MKIQKTIKKVLISSKIHFIKCFFGDINKYFFLKGQIFYGMWKYDQNKQIFLSYYVWRKCFKTILKYFKNKSTNIPKILNLENVLKYGRYINI